MAAALACHAIGLSALLVDAAPLGGLLRLSEWPMDATLGALGGTGREMAARMAADIARAGIPLHPAAARGIDAAGRRLLLDGAPDALPYEALIVATGVRFRTTGLPGETEAEGKWFFNRPPLAPRPGPPGRRVLVLGGGDNAFSTAVLEAETAREVVIALREHPRAHPWTIEAAARCPNISLRTGFRAVRIASLPTPRIHFATAAGEEVVTCDVAYANLGYAPNSEWTGGALRLSEEGAIAVDAEFRTSVPGIWAVGEVTGLPAPCVQTALGHAPVAAQAVAAMLRDEAAVSAALAAMERRTGRAGST